MIILDDNVMVCSDCIMFIANSEEPADNADGWTAENFQAYQDQYWGIGADIACGDSEKDEEFSSRPCEGCGCTLAGSRHHCAVLQHS